VVNFRELMKGQAGPSCVATKMWVWTKNPF